MQRVLRQKMITDKKNLYKQHVIIFPHDVAKDLVYAIQDLLFLSIGDPRTKLTKKL